MSSPKSKRRFECVGGGANKFWEIETCGKEVLVRFGRNGTSGQSATKRLPTRRSPKRTPAN